MTQPVRVLLMEDDSDIARLIQLNLERSGYRVAVASDGQAGLEEFFCAGADLVLLDVKMPQLDGWDVCRRLRVASSLPIIIVTACAQAADRAKGLSLGADDYLCKPFTAGELLARMQAVLQSRSSVEAPVPAHAGEWPRSNAVPTGF